MKRLACIALVALVLSGCGTFRKVFKSKESHSVKVEQSSASNITTNRVDRSTTIITERIDTTITTPARVVVGQVLLNMDSLVNGLTAIKNELIDVTLHLNPITGILTANAKIKPVPVPVQLDRTIIKQNDIIDQSNNLTTTDLKSEANDTQSTTDKQPVKMGVWLVALAIIVAVGGFLFWTNSKR